MRVSCIGEVEVQGGTKPPGMVVSGGGEGDEQCVWFWAVLDGQRGSMPVLNKKGSLDWAYFGLGVCVGWVFKLGWISFWFWFLITRVRFGF